MRNLSLFLALTIAASFSYAQTADEIINKYLTVTGGVEN